MESSKTCPISTQNVDSVQFLQNPIISVWQKVFIMFYYDTRALSLTRGSSQWSGNTVTVSITGSTYYVGLCLTFFHVIELDIFPKAQKNGCLGEYEN